MQQETFDAIKNSHQNTLANFDNTFRRALIDEIDWEERLVFILGARGVGKTTLILQRIKEQFNTIENALYVSMDDLVIGDSTLMDIATIHQAYGGTHLFIDEIHKYSNWSQELKNIYDKYKKLKVVVSGSSILEIQKGKADLSRRAVDYNMQGLSLREFINIEMDLDLPALKLEDILSNHLDIAHQLTQVISPLEKMISYYRYGYYPFFLEGTKNYSRKLQNVVNLTLEVDMPMTLGVDISKVPVIRKLIYLLSGQVPFALNATKMSEALEVDRGTLLTYLHYLEKASIFQLLWKAGKSYSLLTKPDKVYLHNCNLFFLTQQQPNYGNLRETFFLNQVGKDNDVRMPLKGDFLVNDHYIFEVGGSNKGYQQIADIENSYVVADNILIGTGNKIPLWLFGFLY